MTITSYSWGAMAELVYASVLGTDSSRIKSSSLFCPTNGRHASLIDKCDLVGKTVCNTVCNRINEYEIGVKKVAVVLGFGNSTILRNYHHFSTYSQANIIVVVKRLLFLFLKYQPLRYSIRLANVRNKARTTMQTTTLAYNFLRRMFTLCPKTINLI